MHRPGALLSKGPQEGTPLVALEADGVTQARPWGEDKNCISPSPTLGLAEEAKADTDSTESPERTKAARFKKRICLRGKNAFKHLHFGGSKILKTTVFGIF